MSHATDWGRRAEALYTTAYARKYRVHDDEIRGVETYRMFCDWLTNVCERFGRTIDVLDLGCGTGRYFAALRNVGELVGLDGVIGQIGRQQNRRLPQHLATDDHEAAR